jgi:hypothetical protein
MACKTHDCAKAAEFVVTTCGFELPECTEHMAALVKVLAEAKAQFTVRAA